MENDTSTDFDLGVDIQESGVDFFKSFHENQAGDGTRKAVTFDRSDNKDTKDTKGAPDDAGPGGKQPQNQNTKKPGEAPSKTVVDENAIMDMIKDSHKPDGKAANTAPGDDGNNSAPSGSESPLTILYNHFTEDLGLPALPEGETFDGTDENFVKWVQDVREETIIDTANQMITEAFTNQKENEPMARDLLSALAKGMNIEDFIATRKYDTITANYLVTDDEDLKESRSERVLRELHGSMNWDAESIDKYINSLKKSGTLEAVAETALPQFIKSNTARKLAADNQALANKQRTDNDVKAHNTKIFETIDGSKEFQNFNIANPKDKQRIKEYMFLPTVDIGGGTRIPQFMADKMAAQRNPNYTLYQALTLMNQGADAANVKTKTENQVKSSLRQKLEQNAQGLKLKPASSSNGAVSTESPKNFIDFDNIEFVN